MNYAKLTFGIVCVFLGYLIYRDMKAMDMIQKKKKCSCKEPEKDPYQQASYYV